MLSTLGGVAGDCTRGVKIRLPSPTGRILAKRAPLGAPSPSATPATHQMLANWEELTNPHLALVALLQAGVQGGARPVRGPVAARSEAARRP